MIRFIPSERNHNKQEQIAIKKVKQKTRIKLKAEVAPPPRLYPVSYVVLGLIGLRGPSTPYELKRAAGRSIYYFWEFSHSQLYDEPERLSKLGLLKERREEGGRRRKTYSLTAAGQKALQAWLREPPTELYEFRDMGVLQLFFSNFMSTTDLVALARTEMELCRKRIAIYEEIAAHNVHRKDAARRMAPLEFGFRVTRTLLDLWMEIAENPPPAPRKSRR